MEDELTGHRQLVLLPGRQPELAADFQAVCVLQTGCFLLLCALKCLPLETYSTFGNVGRPGYVGAAAGCENQLFHLCLPLANHNLMANAAVFVFAALLSICVHASMTAMHTAASAAAMSPVPNLQRGYH